jgi:signal transduction histidine kinase
MSFKRRKAHPAILFAAAVIIPSLLLGMVAVRAINREELFVEKRLQETLLVEVNHVVSLINGEIAAMQRELDGAFIFPMRDPRSSATSWKRSSPLVDIPFVLSDSMDLLFPGKNEEDAKALSPYLSFFRGETTVPVYMNVALAFTGGPGEQGQDMAQRPDNSQGREEAQYNERQVSQQAIAEFRQSGDIRRKAYRKATLEGLQVSARNVSPQQKDEDASIFVSAQAKFSDITRRSGSGIIPFSDKGRLSHIFWKKNGASGLTAGCLLRLDILKKRIIGVLPDIYSSARILTVLDENGSPLVYPRAGAQPDWRKPFVCVEINEILPRWEVAAYLTDPRAVSARAQVTAILMWILVLILFSTITVGGTLVMKALQSGLALAEQKAGFVTSVSHELKTPLTSIRMFAEMLRQKRQPDEAKREKYLDIIVSETDRLARLINNVLDFSKLDQGKKKYRKSALDLVPFCLEVLESQKTGLEHQGFEVSFVSALKEVSVLADGEALRQVMLNLISNAEKYSEKSKSVEMEVALRGRSAVIRVSDRGIGIPPADGENIFKEFYRADDSLTAKTGGTGLGLAISRKIIRDHGGDVRYLPRPGGGSVFEVLLPVRSHDRNEAPDQAVTIAPENGR